MATDQTPVDELDELEEEELEEESTEPNTWPEVPEGREITVVAEGLSKDYTYKGGVICAVDNVSFKFAEGQFITIVGPSGSGKSTLLYVLGGMDHATTGDLFIDGVDVHALPDYQEHIMRRERLGFIFQSFHLLDHLSALENVLIPMQLAGGKSYETMVERAKSLLIEVGIPPERHGHKPGKLSGGQKQRVAIARALANDPKVILADEPTGNLDSRSSKVIVNLLRKLADQGKTIVVVTHDRSITRIADVKLEMEDGKLKPMPPYVGPSMPVVKKTVVADWEKKTVTITADALTRHFKTRSGTIKAVEEASFKFRTSQFVTIMGPSGSGKTTLLYLLSGLDKATRGDLTVDGVDVQKLRGSKENRFRRAQMGFIFQSYHLLPHLTALENVLMPMQLLGGMKPDEMLERAQSLLYEVGLHDDRFHHYPNKLSGGQQQRVAIARALANDPQVILADEPTGNLDSYNGRLIIQMLRKLADEGKTVVVVTHDRSISKIADLRMEINDGRVRSTGDAAPTTTKVVTRPVSHQPKKKAKKK